jgi:hypothetical protein
MTEIEIQLRQEDAKLVFLAVAYHLGRPGSELDPITKQPVERGLADTARELQPQLRNAVASVHLIEPQLKRLQSGMLGSITELKAYGMMGARKSTVPGFDGALRHLFPEVDDDAENALHVAEHMLLLKRRLDQRVAELPAEQPSAAVDQPRRRWWPFGR